MTGFDADNQLAAEVLAAWPEQAPAVLSRLFRPDRALLVVGEGSSQLMPGGFLRACARAWAWTAPIDAIGGRAADLLDLTGRSVVCVSNSGRSREVVEAMPRLPADACALVGVPGGQLARLPHQVLLPRAEQAIPASASVFATCLVLGQALALAARQPVPLARLRSGLAGILAAPPQVPGARDTRRIFWLGGQAGVTAELALKTMESTGLIGLDLPGSLGLHGIHEVLAPGDLVVAHDIADADRAELHRRVETLCGASLLFSAPPDCGVWTPLLHLATGWRILAAVAAAQGRDPTTPLRATKIGNPAI